VVADPANPENEGKIKIYKFGKKIFDKILEALNPPFDEMGRPPEHPQYSPTNAFNPFDLLNGANFKIKIRKQGGFPNYDNSAFDTPKALNTDEKVLEDLWKKCYSLNEFVAPDKFKTYDELKKSLYEVLGEAPSATAPASNKGKDLPKSLSENVPDFNRKAKPPGPTDTIDDLTKDDDDDVNIDYFKALANE
jgi:hypothetical protein